MASFIPNVKIVSDGTARGTRVYSRSGEEIEGLTGIEIEITPDRGCIATLCFGLAQLELDAVVVINQPAATTAPVSFDQWMYDRIQRAHEDFLSVDLGALDKRIALAAQLQEMYVEMDQRRNAVKPCVE